MPYLARISLSTGFVGLLLALAAEMNAPAIGSADVYSVLSNLGGALAFVGLAAFLLILGGVALAKRGGFLPSQAAPGPERDSGNHQTPRKQDQTGSSPGSVVAAT